MKYRNSGQSVDVVADTLTATHNQKLKDKSGTITLDEDFGTKGLELRAANTAQEARDAIEVYSELEIQSREGGLVNNSNLELEDNTGFSSFDYSPEGAPGKTKGSLVVTGGTSVARFSDEFIPISAKRSYIATLCMRNGSADGSNYEAGSSHFIGIQYYKADKTGILAVYWQREVGTETRLAADLKPGDPTIQLVSAKNWNNSSVGAYKYFAWYGWQDADGNTYPDYSYTENVSAIDFWAAGAVDTVNNTITLNAPWVGNLIPAGTAVANHTIRNTLNYAFTGTDAGDSALVIGNDWVDREIVISGANVDFSSVSTTYLSSVIPAPAAYARLVMQANVGAATGANNLHIAGFNIIPIAPFSAYQDDVKALYEPYVQSREANNLFSNGNGFTGDNTNMSAFEFTPEFKAGRSVGSFKASGALQAKWSDEFIPVEIDKRGYKISLCMKNGGIGGTNFDAGTGHLVGVSYYDKGKKQIFGYHYERLANTNTTLAQDLNPGDPTIVLTDISNWHNDASIVSQRFAWYPYQPENSESYGNYGYTRNISRHGLWDAGGIDYATNTITLTQPWEARTEDGESVGAIPAGTPISNATRYGGTYHYNLLGGGVLTNDWQEFSVELNGVNVEGDSRQTAFPPGTAFIKLHFIYNYTGNQEATNELHVTAIEVKPLEVEPGTVGALSYAANTEEQGQDAIGLFPRWPTLTYEATNQGIIRNGMMAEPAEADGGGVLRAHGWEQLTAYAPESFIGKYSLLWDGAPNTRINSALTTVGEDTLYSLHGAFKSLVHDPAETVRFSARYFDKVGSAIERFTTIQYGDRVTGPASVSALSRPLNVGDESIYIQANFNGNAVTGWDQFGWAYATIGPYTDSSGKVYGAPSDDWREFYSHWGSLLSATNAVVTPIAAAASPVGIDELKIDFQETSPGVFRNWTIANPAGGAWPVGTEIVRTRGGDGAYYYGYGFAPLAYGENDWNIFTPERYPGQGQFKLPSQGEDWEALVAEGITPLPRAVSQVAIEFRPLVGATNPNASALHWANIYAESFPRKMLEPAMDAAGLIYRDSNQAYERGRRATEHDVRRVAGYDNKRADHTTKNMRGQIVAMSGQDSLDIGMTGALDRNLLTNAHIKNGGSIAATLTGAGNVASQATLGYLLTNRPRFINLVSNADETTEIDIVVDLGYTLNNLSYIAYIPFFNSRLRIANDYGSVPAFGWFNSIQVHVATETAPNIWITPANNDWIDNDVTNSDKMQTNTLWMPNLQGVPAGISSTTVFRYVRFRLTDYTLGANGVGTTMVSAIGMRHVAPDEYYPQYLRENGDRIYGALVFENQDASRTLSINSGGINQNGVSWRIHGTATIVATAGLNTINVPNTAVGDTVVMSHGQAGRAIGGGDIEFNGDDVVGQTVRATVLKIAG